MKNITSFLLILLTGLLFAGGLEYPKIITVEHEFAYRKANSEFVDFNYLIEIQGAYREYKMLLEVELYNVDEECIKVYREIVTIKKSKRQAFEGTKLIPIELADEVEFVGANLKLLEKKY